MGYYSCSSIAQDARCSSSYNYNNSIVEGGGGGGGGLFDTYNSSCTNTKKPVYNLHLTS